LKKKILGCLILLSVAAIDLWGQQYAVFINVNQYYPIGKTHSKSSYPILWYSSEGKNILLGGLGVGVKMEKDYDEKMAVVGKAQMTRYRQYDEPLQLVDENGGPIGDVQGVITEYGLGGQLGINYRLGKNVKTGIGLSATGIWYSKSDYNIVKAIDNEKVKFKNKYYKPILVSLPIGLTYDFDRMYISSTYEIGLINRLKGESSAKEYAGILTFEIGFNLQ
jgi:hypothetical protein